MTKNTTLIDESAADASTLGDKAAITYEERLNFVNDIAKPMASRKLTKRIHKLIKKAYKEKSAFWAGLKSVQTKIRRGGEGIVILAGDVNPIDIYTHLPALCEDKELPYVFVPSREDIGLAMGVNRAVVTVFIGLVDGYKENFEEVLADIKLLPIPL